FKKAIAIDPDFAMAYARLGYTIALVQEHLEDAKPLFREALKRTERLTDFDRIQIQAWYALADQDYGAAIRLYRSIVGMRPGEAEGYWRLGTLLAGEENFDDAIDVMQRGLTIAPDSRDLLNGLGLVFSDVGRYSEGIAICERLVAVAPQEPNA